MQKLKVKKPLQGMGVTRKRRQKKKKKKKKKKKNEKHIL